MDTANRNMALSMTNDEWSAVDMAITARINWLMQILKKYPDNELWSKELQTLKQVSSRMICDLTYDSHSNDNIVLRG